MIRLYVLILCFGVLMLYLVGKRWQLMQKNISLGEANSLLKTTLNQNNTQSTARRLVWGARGFFQTYIDLFYRRQRKVLIRNIVIVIGVIMGALIFNKFVTHQDEFNVIGAGFILSLLVLVRVEKRILQKSFSRVFPEALSVINGALTSGNSISQALADCALIMPEPLGEEFGRISRRLNVGEAPERVLKSSYKRLPFKEYYFFTVAILINLKSGARLREVLLRLGKTVANAKAIESKKMAMTSEVRMSSKITAIIPFIFLFGLQYLSPINYEYIMNDPDGRGILYYFLGSEAFGMVCVMFLMRKL